MKAHIFKRILSVLLTLSMLVGLPLTVSYADDNAAAKLEQLELTEIDAAGLSPAKKLDDKLTVEKEQHAATEYVRVSVVLDKPGTLAAGYAVENIAKNAGAKSYRAGLKSEQSTMTAKIAAAVNGRFEVKRNLTLAANIISANVMYGQINAIKSVAGVKDVILENRYDVDEAEKGDDPNMATSSVQIGSNYAWAAGYTGVGSKVAVIDTGADIEHQSFSGEGLEYSLGLLAEDAGMSYDEYCASVGLMTKADVEAVADQLNAKIDVDQTYISTKIPYGYNYVDNNQDVGHTNDTEGEHGSHVAGIAVANKYVKVGDEFKFSLDEVAVQGVAPDAQLVVMKVFGAGGGAYDSDYMAAIEDAIILGCDAANLSLGSAAPGVTFSDGYQEIMDSLVENGMVVNMSAGNNGMWYDTPLNPQMEYPYLYLDDTNFQTGGSPGTFNNSLSTASVDNNGQTGFPLDFGDGLYVFYFESSGYGNEPFTSLASLGTLDYVLIDGPGVADNDYSGNQFAEIGSEVLSGKVAICKRGSSSFYAKANAAVEQGAIGVIIFNNVEGAINMNLTGYEYSAPAVSITLNDGEAIIAQSEKHETESGQAYYTGSFSASDQLAVLYGEAGDFQTVSSFSAYGVPGSLILKPEIAAPGGSIYSVFGYNKTDDGYTGGSDKYELMSGTSMASPQVAGIAAVLGQYIRENGLCEKTGLSQRQLINSLVMSTAHPIYDEYGDYYPVIRVGAGLANVGDAINATSYILMDGDSTILPESARDGKVKVELGDDPERTGEYSYKFTYYPLEEGEKQFTLRTDMFIQWIAGDAGYGMLMDTGTMLFDSDVTYEVNGVTYGSYVPFDADVNGDGKTDAKDAQDILDYVTAKLDSAAEFDAEVADVDGDGEVTSYDAHIILKSIVTPVITVSEPTEVKVNIVLNKADLGFIDSYFTNGLYVQGYTYVEPYVTEEGEITDSIHSIPILGFYGSFTEPSMVDRDSALDAAYGTGKLPYLDESNTNYLTFTDADGSSYVFMGNPYAVEDELPAGRFAVRSDALLGSAVYSPIRSAGTLGAAVMNDGKVLWSKVLGEDITSAFYHNDQGRWFYTSPRTARINKNLSDIGLKEDDVVSIGVYLLPEYYAIRYALENDVVPSGALNEDGFKSVLESGTVGDGASIAYDFTVDDTAPVISAAMRDVLSGDFIIAAADNNYVAYVALMTKSGKLLTGIVPENSDKGELAFASLTTEGMTIPSEVVLLVADYAGNETAYEVDLGGASEDFSDRIFGFTSAEVEPGSGPRAVELDPETLYYTKDGEYEGIDVFSETPAEIIAAEYVDGYVYMASEDALFVAPIDDLTDVSLVSTLDVFVYDLAFNYADETLYALDDSNTIYAVDLYTGNLTKVAEVKAGGDDLGALAIDDNGTFYTVGIGYRNDVYLYSFALADAEDGVIADPVKAENMVGAFFMKDGGYGSIAWDHTNDRLYLAANWAGDDYDYDHNLFIVDTETGTGTKVNDIESQGSCFGVPLAGLFIVPSASSLIVNPTDEVLELDIVPADLSVLLGQTLEVSVVVKPWTAKNKEVVWTSDDESVLSVTEDGIVTGVSVGEATLTVTSVATPDTYTSITVVVENAPVASLKGFLWDENGAGHWVAFDSDRSAEWTTLGDGLSFRWAALVDDVLYTSTSDTMYAVDADTYEITTLGSIVSDWIPSDADFIPADMSSAWGLTGRVAGICSDGQYFEILDPESGKLDYFILSDYFSSDPMAAITFAGRGDYTDSYGDTIENVGFYFVITESGAIYRFTLDLEGYLYFDEIGETGISLEGASDVTNEVWASLEYDEASGFLYLARYDGESDYADLFTFDASNPLRRAELGNFKKNVWPVVGLYQYDPATDLTLKVNPDSVKVFEGTSAQLNIKVKLGETNQFTVESADESVATVDATGLITGVAGGETVVTVTTVDTNAAGEHISVDVPVKVNTLKQIDTLAIGQLSAEGEDYFGYIDLSDMSASAFSSAPGTVTAGAQCGKYYFAGMDDEIEVLDISTFEETEDEVEIDSYYSEFPAQDIANYPDFKNNKGELVQNKALFTTTDGWLVTPDYNGWDFSSLFNGTMAAIEFAGTYSDTDSETGVTTEYSIYYLLTTDGELYELDFNYAKGTFSISFVTDGLPTLADQSDASMAWVEDYDSETGNIVNAGLIIAINSTGEIWYIDFLAESEDDFIGFVGVFNLDNFDGLIGAYDSIDSLVPEEDPEHQPDAIRFPSFAKTTNAAFKTALASVAIGSETIEQTSMAEALKGDAAGSLNAVKGYTATKIDSVARPEAISFSDETADGEVTVNLVEDEAVSNGVFRVTYDTEALTFTGAYSTGLYSVNEVEPGVIFFAYAYDREVAAGADVGTLKFTYADGYVDTSVKVEVLERGAYPVEDEEIVVTINHEDGEHVWEETGRKDATCTEDGYIEYTCSKCKTTMQEIILKTGHNLVVDAAVAATCTETGLTAGIHCVNCDKVFVAQTVIEALGHDEVAAPEVAATCTEPGSTGGTVCSRCGITLTASDPIAPLNHSWGEWVVDTEATYTTEGSRHHDCTRCDASETEVIAVNDLPFVDVPKTAWFYNAVVWALENEVTAGTDDTHFGPNGPITRAQFVTFLYAAAGKPEVKTENNPFTDVKAGKYYYKAVLWAVENGITSGTSATTFSPNQKCTREQIVTFLYAFAGKPSVSLTSCPFKDVKASKYYYTAVLWAFENSITYGTGADVFGVGNVAPRSQVVTFLYAFFGANRNG